MKKNIAILLPYKEKYTLKDAAAASIWVKDYLKISKLRDQTLVFGNLPKNKKPLTKDFVNIDLSKVKFKKNYFYTKKFYKDCKDQKFEVIEIHNRPESLIFLLKRSDSCTHFTSSSVINFPRVLKLFPAPPKVSANWITHKK